jgi:hypothetical protein
LELEIDLIDGTVRCHEEGKMIQERLMYFATREMKEEVRRMSLFGKKDGLNPDSIIWPRLRSVPVISGLYSTRGIIREPSPLVIFR